MADIMTQIAVQTKVKQGLAEMDFANAEVKAFFIQKYCPTGTTDIELAEFISTAVADEAIPGEDIYLVPYGGKKVIQHSINWMTRKANESGDFVGFTDPEYQDEAGNWTKNWESKKLAPRACRIGVIKKSTDKIGYSTCRWDERFKDQAQWKESGQPIHMLTKCTKAQGLRDAGFKGCKGRYIVEEMLEHDMPNGEWQPGQCVEAGKAAMARVEKRNELQNGYLDPGAKPQTPQQKGRIMKWREDNQKTTEDLKLKVSEILGEEIKSLNGLTHDQAEKVLAALEATT